MPKITIADLKKIKETHKAELALREGEQRAKVTVHMGTCGIAAGARKVMEAIIQEVADADVADVAVTTSGCAGLCSREPMVTVEVLGEPPVKYVDIDADKMRKIFKEHLQGGNIVEDYAFVTGSETAY